jgi:hypothetical protein
MTPPAKDEWLHATRTSSGHAVSQCKQASRSVVLTIDKKSTSETAEAQALLLQVVEALSEEKALSSFFHQIVVGIANKFAATGAYLCLHCQEKDVLSLEVFCSQQQPLPIQSSNHTSVSLSRTVKPCSLAGDVAIKIVFSNADAEAALRESLLARRLFFQ